ncbi:hypothetical protein [Nocardiopsis sp. NPDC006938]|uniref:hypothetical protein n=1 Tax=Nocardiopsis sp. NPDC006938 TaxID=3364337 RepID=UPI00368DAFBC
MTSPALSSWSAVSSHLVHTLLATARTCGYAPTVRDGATYPTILLTHGVHTVRVYLAATGDHLRWHWETTRTPLQAPATDPTLVLTEITRTLDGEAR